MSKSQLVELGRGYDITSLGSNAIQLGGRGCIFCYLVLFHTGHVEFGNMTEQILKDA